MSNHSGGRSGSDCIADNVDRQVDLQNKIVRAVRDATGLHEHIAVPVADEIMTLLQREFGGSRVYIPSATRRAINRRNEQVIADFSGNNHDEVCRKYGISRATLYRLVGNR